MPCGFTYMWNLKKNINERTKQKHTHRYIEKTDGFQRRGGLGDWGKKMKAFRSADWQLTLAMGIKVQPRESGK